jgi:hypothetical protein
MTFAICFVLFLVFLFNWFLWGGHAQDTRHVRYKATFEQFKEEFDKAGWEYSDRERFYLSAQSDPPTYMDVFDFVFRGRYMRLTPIDYNKAKWYAKAYRRKHFPKAPKEGLPKW